LIRDYQDTVKELSGPSAQTLEPFRLEYEKLYKALLMSNESEKRLTKKIRDLSSEIAVSAASVQSAMKVAAEDERQITALKEDIKMNTKRVQESLEKEEEAKEAISKYQSDIAALQDQIENGAGLTPEQVSQLRQLAIQKDKLEKDRDVLKQSTDVLVRICNGRLEEVQRLEAARTKSEEQVIGIRQMIAEKRSEVEAEKRRKEELEQNMKDLRIENEMKGEECKCVSRSLQSEECDLQKVEADVQQGEQEEDALERKARTRMEEKRKIEDKLEQEMEKNRRYVQENQQRELQMRAKKDQIALSNTECERLTKMHEVLKKKDRLAGEERLNLESQRNTLKHELKTTQEKVDADKKEMDSDRKKIEDLLRERDILNKSVIKADERTRKQINLVKQRETQAMNLQKDIVRWKSEALEFRKRISEVEKQREKYGVELTQANTKYAAAKDELKARGVVLTELKKQIQNVEAKLNQQKNLYDAVCLDRNLHAKNLEGSKEQIVEMRRKFKVVFHATTALKEEIRDKDNRVIRGHFKQKDVMQMNEKLKESKEKAQRRVRNLMVIVEAHRAQMKKLENTIQEAESESQAQSKELEGVVGERDILGAQLIRRNEELALLYEKIKIQQSTLQKGEHQYNERVEEVRKLRSEIRRAHADVANAKTQVVNVESLKQEIHSLTKTLLREEAKAKALQEELENPMNVHRWRELEGSDPAIYEMIQKVKSLQKMLISKTEEVVEKDALIQEKEKLYVQLKNIIARQPGPEVAEQLAWYSQNLKEKTAHMKQMGKELEMYHDQVHNFREEIERHNKTYQQIKQAYFQRLRGQRKELTMASA